MIMASANSSAAMKVKLVLAWCFVGIPLLWGVLRTIENSLALFR
jgi:hypothetical protein